MINDTIALAILRSHLSQQVWEEYDAGDNWNRRKVIMLQEKLHAEKYRLRQIATKMLLAEKTAPDGTPPYIDIGGRRWYATHGYLQATKLHRLWTDAEYDEAIAADYASLIEKRRPRRFF